MEREALMVHGEQREEQEVKQPAGVAAGEEEGMPELTLKQALVGHGLPPSTRNRAAVGARVPEVQVLAAQEPLLCLCCMPVFAHGATANR